MIRNTVKLKKLLDQAQGDFKGTSLKAFYEMINKHKVEITKAVKAFAKEEGVRAGQVKLSLESLFDKQLDNMDEYYIFLIGDALGCDDLGLREDNPELDFIYATIFSYWVTNLQASA
jgi:hypothetical protein